jgi:hypothetical protein
MEGKSNFAVITDTETLKRCAADVDRYKAVLESEGLPVFVVSHDWKSPYEVKTVLKKLHDENGLEGCVLVGDIPIAMVTKAQHLTSAFKMDEQQFPIKEASVPTDRFYDDFDLEFIPQGTAQEGLFHYYELSPSSPQYIDCDIYSARIKAQSSGGDKYEQISHFLSKAVEQHNETNRLDRFVSYTGDGSYSNSLVAWRAERQLLDEQFGDLFAKNNNAIFLRYSMEPSMKKAASMQLRRDDTDVMVFHEHGLPERQYLTGEPETSGADEAVESVKRYLRNLYRRDKEYAAEIADKFGVSPQWYDNALDSEQIAADSLADLLQGIILEDVDTIAPNARFVIFDACYNGDFRENDYIAGKYIFADGKCTATFGNTVNVLQDKSAFDLLGLLSCGVRIGNWARHINILESHITGDPTLRFTPSGAAGETDMNLMIANDDPEFWKGYLGHDIPDVRNMALIKMFNANYKGISDILYDQFINSKHAVVRWNAFRLLEQLSDANFRKALPVATTDGFEFIRRKAVTWMGRVGDDSYIPYLVDSYRNDYNSARVLFNIDGSLDSFDKNKVVAGINNRFADAKYYNAAAQKKALTKRVDPEYYRVEYGSADDSDDETPMSRSESSFATIMDKKRSAGGRKAYIRFLKNQPYNQYVDSYISLLEDEAEDMQIRILMAESLAWFRESVHRESIMAAGKRILSKGTDDPVFEKELTRMVARLGSPK